jgi:hypothetical protein
MALGSSGSARMPKSKSRAPSRSSGSLTGRVSSAAVARSSWSANHARTMVRSRAGLGVSGLAAGCRDGLGEAGTAPEEPLARDWASGGKSGTRGGRAGAAGAAWPIYRKLSAIAHGLLIHGWRRPGLRIDARSCRALNMLTVKSLNATAALLSEAFFRRPRLSGRGGGETGCRVGRGAG